MKSVKPLLTMYYMYSALAILAIFLTLGLNVWDRIQIYLSIAGISYFWYRLTFKAHCHNQYYAGVRIVKNGVLILTLVLGVLGTVIQVLNK